MSRRRGDTTVLATLLFTDIVGSTEIAVELGDRRWRDLIQRHHAIVRRELKRHRGRELDTAGDGFFVRFDRPADAVRCADAICSGVRELGIEVRAGLHLGEVEVLDGKVGGIAVNVAARVMGLGKAGEVLVSSTLRDAVAGSGFGFADHGVHRLKGIEGEWRLYDVTSVDGARRAAPLTEDEVRTRRSFVEGTPVGRRRDRLVAAALGASVVGVVAVGIFTGAFDRRSTADAPTSPDPTLLRLVPPAFRERCDRSPSTPPEAIASVDCTDGDLYAVSYARYRSTDAVRAAFERFASPADATATDCATDASARGEYTVNSVPAGLVACYVDEASSPGTTESVIVWTDDEHSVLGRAIRRDPADLTLYEWWRVEAGPWSTEASPEKDGAARAPIDGVFRAEDGARTLTFSGGRYLESDFGEIYGDAVPLYGKPSLLLLLHESPPTTFGGEVCPRYEIYRYRFDRDRLVLRLVTGSCREYASRDIDGVTFVRAE